MSAEEHEAVRAELPVATRAIAGGPRFAARLTEILSRRPMPQILLIAAEDPAAHR